jgi:hypothetical protein
MGSSECPQCRRFSATAGLLTFPCLRSDAACPLHDTDVVGLPHLRLFASPDQGRVSLVKYCGVAAYLQADRLHATPVCPSTPPASVTHHEKFSVPPPSLKLQ